MESRIAFVVSRLTHPLLVPAVVFAILLFIDRTLIPISDDQRIYFWLFLALSTFLFPLLGFKLLQIRQSVASLTTFSSAERSRLLFTIFIYYFILAVLVIQKLGSDDLLALLIAGMALALFAAWVFAAIAEVNISLHGLAQGGAAGFYAGVSALMQSPWAIWPAAGFTFAMGLGMASSLALGRRNEAETYIGAVVGMVCGLAIVLIQQMPAF